MSLGRGVLVGVAMAALAVASGCKSSSDQGSPSTGTGSDPGVQAPNDTAAPANSSEDPSARRGRRHRGPGQGEWHRKRRAAAGDSGSDPGTTPPAVPQQ